MAGIRLRLPLTGLHCASCVKRVEDALRRVEGVREVEVQLAPPLAQIETGVGFRLTAVRDSLKRAGYGIATVHSLLGGAVDAIQLDSLRALPGVLSVEQAGDVVAVEHVPSITPSSALPAGAPSLRLEPAQAVQRTDPAWRDAPMTIALAVLVMVLSMLVPHSGHVQAVLAAFVVFGYCLRFHLGLWRMVRYAAPDMDTLISIGTLAAFGFSVAQLARGHAEHLYFETAAMIAAVVLLGRAIEARARRRMGDAVRALLALAPERAVRLRDGVKEEVRPEELVPGDIVAVYPGESFPADGRVVEGSSTADESFLTGESMPVEKATGDAIYGGTLNHGNALKVRIERAGRDTVLAKIAELVERAQASKTRLQRQADRVAAVFVPAILAAAAGTFAGWWLGTRNPAVAWVPAVAVLVVACPCALGLAAPIAAVAGLGAASRRGVLVKSAATIEALAAFDTVVFDKTGTLTWGRPTVRATHAAPGVATERVLVVAAAVEAASRHPLAEAIVRAAPQGRPEAKFHGALPGEGVRAQIDGEWAFVGKLAAPPLLPPATPGATRVYVTHGERFLGAIDLADAIRPEARQVVADLKARNVRPLLVTGDSKAVADEVALELKIGEVHAEVLPDGKAEIVRRLVAGGRLVAFVGDGINDAPALAAATVGIALATGSDIAVAAGDVVLPAADLGRVLVARDVAGKTLRVMKQNFAWAAVYNAALVPLAAFGVVHPMLAAAAMAASSVSVVLNGLRARR